MNESPIDWKAANYRYRMRVDMVKPKLEPPIDEIVSQIVGRKIYTQDPRLIKLVVKWKQGKPIDSMEPDNFLSDPHKIEELKKVLNESL